MRAWRLSVLILLLCSGAALAALQFPALAGRVTDAAHILSPATQQSLDRMLADYERGSGNQIVVVTLPSLEGDSIESYGYQLGRAWQIGQKGKDNGALLIVAPHERKVRIEVGYGLEPLLTDAASSAIVQGIILPQFRAGHMEQGVLDGAQAMISALGGKSVAAPQRVSGNEHAQGGDMPIWLMVLLILWFFYMSSRHPFLSAYMLSSLRFGGSSSGSGGFSGGGGSFGGGGASGSW